MTLPTDLIPIGNGPPCPPLTIEQFRERCVLYTQGESARGELTGEFVMACPEGLLREVARLLVHGEMSNGALSDALVRVLENTT